MKRYKITATTIQGNKYFFCCWKMDNKYLTRLVILQSECIFYMEDELQLIQFYLNKNLERLQIKTYSIDEVTYQPTSVKAQKQIDAGSFRSDAKPNKRYGAII